MKALAAGYDVGEVEEFGGKTTAEDSAWLQEHLAPVTTGSGPRGRRSRSSVTSTGSQDDETCVPSSTVTARALVDPVYALELTGGPERPGRQPRQLPQAPAATSSSG